MLAAYHVHVVLVPYGDDGEAAGAGMVAGSSLPELVDVEEHGNEDHQGDPV